MSKVKTIFKMYGRDFKIKKPTVEQTAWVVSKIIESSLSGGTYRKCIYGFMGYGMEAYIPLCSEGTNLLELNNFIYAHQEDFIKRFGE